jgi:spore coat polysaccharide biosynthesis protein SpsF
MAIVAIIQARMGSSRLPGKMMMDLCGYPVLYWVLHRVKQAKKLDDVILATSDQNRDDPLAHLAGLFNIKVFRGSEEDVLGRYVGAAHWARAVTIVRVCADNPFIAPEEIDRLVEFYCSQLQGGGKPETLYAFNHITTDDNHYPDGLGAEVFSRMILENLARMAITPYHREHVTTYLRDHPETFKILPVIASPEIAFPSVKLDIDTWEDYERLRELCNCLSLSSSALDIVKAYLEKFRVD